MPYEEFQGWMKYFKQRPIGWREDHRTALLLNAQGVKKQGHEIFPSLAAINRSSTKAIDPKFLRKLMTAKGGDEWSPKIE